MHQLVNWLWSILLLLLYGPWWFTVRWYALHQYNYKHCLDHGPRENASNHHSVYDLLAYLIFLSLCIGELEEFVDLFSHPACMFSRSSTDAERYMTYVVWSSKISLKSVKFSFCFFLTNCMHHFHSCILQKTPLNLVNWFQRYEQLKEAKKKQETKDIFCFVWLYLKISISDFRLILLDHITYTWHHTTKQGTSRRGLFEILAIEVGNGVKNDPSANFEFDIILYHLYLILGWFASIFT